MKKDITVHCIAQSGLNLVELQQWLNAVGANEFTLPGDVTDASALVGVAAKRCYNSFEPGLNPNVTKVRTDWAKYIDNILASGHGSVLEHATWTWAIEGCTRVFTAECNRHRAGVAISEASLRYIRFDSNKGIPYWEPRSIQPNEGDEAILRSKKNATRSLFRQAFDDALRHYRVLEGIWEHELAGDFSQKKALTSMFRRIIPLGVSVGAVYTFNTRALRHVMTMRCSPAAEEEIAYVFGMIAKSMFSSEPQLFGDFEETEGGFWVPRYKKV